MDIAAAIKDLERQRAHIDTAIASLRALGGHSPAKRQTIMGGILAHLEKAGASQTSAEIRQALSAMGVHASAMSIQTMMSKRARLKKDLIHKGRGLWALKK